MWGPLAIVHAAWRTPAMWLVIYGSDNGLQTKAMSSQGAGLVGLAATHAARGLTDCFDS